MDPGDERRGATTVVDLLLKQQSNQQQHGVSSAAEVLCVWPPVVCIQTPAVVEVQVGVTRTTTHVGVCADGSPAVAAACMLAGGPSPLPAGINCNSSPTDTDEGCQSSELAASPLLRQLSGCDASQPAKLLTIGPKDTVVAAEPMALTERGEQSMRVRVSEQEPTVLSFLVGDEAGIPTYASIKAPGLLPVLPAQACSEMQTLLWLMMQEVLTPDTPTPAMEVFSTPLSQLPPPLQQAAVWAWTSHFRHLAADINYCLDFVPGLGSEHEQDFRDVLCNLTAFLRDHDAWATLACLLASCAARGCVLLSASSPLNAKDLSPECLAAMSSPGFPWSPAQAALEACHTPPMSSPTSCFGSALEHLSGLSLSPTSSRFHPSSPLSPLVGTRALCTQAQGRPANGSEGLLGMGPHKHSGLPQCAASAQASPLRRVAYLYTSCCGRGVWAEEAGERGGVGEEVSGKSSSVGSSGGNAAAHREFWCAGSIMAMILMAVTWGAAAVL